MATLIPRPSPGGGMIDASSIILSARVAQTNAEIFPDVLKLYVPEGAKVLDMTWGRGVFWKRVPKGAYKITANDLDKSRGRYHYDFSHLPPQWKERFDAVVLDPPYLGVGGIKTLKDSIDRSYNNRLRARKMGAGIKATQRVYAAGMIEAHRVLRRSGVLILKAMDQVESGEEQKPLTHEMMELGRILGFKFVDEMIMVLKHTPMMRHATQKHSRHNHSSFVVLRRRP